MTTLELGSGRNPTPGAIHHDRTKHAEHVDLAFDLNVTPWPVEDGSFDKIIAIDLFEHLDLPVHDWLTECHRILKPGGVLDFRVPHWSSAIAYENPTHRRAFAEKSFDFWDDTKVYHQQYGAFDPELAADGKLWRVMMAMREGGNILFRLQVVK